MPENRPTDYTDLAGMESSAELIDLLPGLLGISTHHAAVLVISAALLRASAAGSQPHEIDADVQELLTRHLAAAPSSPFIARLVARQTHEATRALAEVMPFPSDGDGDDAA